MMRFILALVLCLLGGQAFAQATYTANIHNAPGWLPSHSYPASSGPPTAPFTRVNNGPAWNGSAYTSGLALNNYQLTSGACTSGSSGGPSGTGTGISDGTCTWKYVSGVDYVSFTGWALDNGTTWTSGTTYGYGHIVHTTDTNAPVYQQQSAGCVSTVKPTGTLHVGSIGGIATDTGLSTADGCYWNYEGNITYTSNAHSVPMEEFFWDSFTGSISGTTLTVTTPPATHPLGVQWALRAPGMIAGTQITAGSGTTWTVNNSQTIASQTIFSTSQSEREVMINDLYVAQLWNDQEYLDNTRGELNQMMIWNHNYRYNDYGTLVAPNPPASTGSNMYGLPITIKAAPGESFADTLAANPGTALAGYNVNNGVGLRGTGAGVYGLMLLDNTLTFTGLQFKADSGGGDLQPQAIGLAGRAANSVLIERSILEGCSGCYAVVAFGAQGYLMNDLIIAHGYGAVVFDYGGRMYNSTVVCTGGGACTVGLENSLNWITEFGVVLNGNAIFGFTHMIGTRTDLAAPIGTCTYNCSTWQGTKNATDVASTDGSTYPSVTAMGPSGNVIAIQQFIAGGAYCASDSDNGTITPGTCQITNSLSPSAAFTTWPGNYRIGPSSTLYGGGATFGNYNKCGIYQGEGPPIATFAGCTVQADTPDILGTTRPQSGRYDIGAVQYALTGPFTFTGNSLSATTFTQGASAPTVIGAVIVGYTGAASGTTTVGLAGTNAQGFRLDANPYPGTNMICPSGGCPSSAGPFTDVEIVATNSAAVGSPYSGPFLSLTGLSAGGTFTFTGNTVGGTTSPTYLQGAAAPTVIGAVNVDSTGTPTGTTTVSLTANPQNFRLDTSTYPGANLICPLAGCPSAAGPFTVGLTATNSAATGSPFTTTITLTGTTSSTPLLRVGIGIRRR